MSNERHEEAGTTTAGLFERLAGGDANAPDDLFTHLYDRLRRLAKSKAATFPRVAVLHQTDDVFHGAAARLVRALREVRPATPGHFWGLAAECIRRELIDLSRKEYGERGDRPNALVHRPGDCEAALAGEAAAGDGPLTEMSQTEFHEKVGKLLEEERRAFEMVFYGGHTYQEVGELLGVSEATAKRRWYAATVRLHELLGGK